MIICTLLPTRSQRFTLFRVISRLGRGLTESSPASVEKRDRKRKRDHELEDSTLRLDRSPLRMPGATHPSEMVLAAGPQYCQMCG
jgi:hypothetical protein